MKLKSVGCRNADDDDTDSCICHQDPRTEAAAFGIFETLIPLEQVAADEYITTDIMLMSL